MSKSYEMVIGLEVHVELATESKIFCSCPTAFGAPPNTQCCPVCSGMPGTLPVLNQKVVDYAVMAGLATNCQIARYSKNDRKNYFYPDLPKAYQISQFDLPLCEHGHIDIATEAGEKRIGITRIHIEEDAGKLVHSPDGGTLIDLNRCGVPLIEIVSEPDMRSPEEAVAYLKKLHSIVLYLGVSDAKMNEGSFRCDVNLSMRPKGAEAFGTRAEIKNLNSFAFVASAIKYEYQRQVETVEAGEAIVQETRRFDVNTGKTFSMRGKENSDDYRYFPDPDLLPVTLADEQVEQLRTGLPRLPDERKAFYMGKYGLSADHSEMLVLDRAMADFYEQAAALSQYPRQAATLIITDVFRLMDGGAEIRISPENLAAIADLLGEGKINNRGGKALLEHLWAHGGAVDALVKELDLLQRSDPAQLEPIVLAVLEENPKMAADYHRGKTAALKGLMGKAMAKTGGVGNPKVLEELLQKHLKRDAPTI